MKQRKGSYGRPQHGLEVIFGQHSALNVDIPESTVLIVPSLDRWNNFGHYIGIDFLIHVRSAEQPVRAHGFIGFIDSDGRQDARELIEQHLSLDGGKTVRITSERAHSFFTMLPDMEAYRRLVQQLDSVDAAAVLTAVNDLVALNEFDSASDILDLAIQTEVFSLSFMRNSETFFAFKNAGPLLHGLSNEKIGTLSSNLAIRFQLPGRKNEHDLKFNFDHTAELPKRMAVIIGKNGVGKSQTLGRIAKAALEGSMVLNDGTEGGRPLINRLLAFAPTNEAESVFPMDRQKRPRIWYQRFSVNRSRRSGRNEYVSDLIVQVARSPQNIADRSRWEIFTKALNAINEHNQLHLVTSSSSLKYVSLDELRFGTEQTLLERFASIDVKKEPIRVVSGEGFPLSSGEISFLKFAAQVSLHIENGSLLLLDEPETHLHPNFISRFVSLLDSLLAATGSAAIIATHSAYFVREVFREQVTVLSIDHEQRVLAQRPALRTFGADVGAISYFVFGEDEPSKLAAEVEERLLASNLPWQGLYEKYKDELSLEMLNTLRAVLDDSDLR